MADNMNFSSLDQWQESFIQNSFTSVKTLYIDLLCLQDFKLGALFSLTSTSKKDYDYIVDHIPNYNERLDNAVMKYFPEITSVTDDDINNYIFDENNQTELSHISPPTDLLDNLHVVLAGIFKCNKVILSDDDAYSVSVIINSNGIPMNEEWMMRYKHHITSNHSNIRVGFMNQDVDQLKENIISNSQFFIFHDIVNTLKQDTCLFNELFVNKSFDNKLIFATKRLDTSLVDTTKLESKKSIDNLFGRTQEIMKLVTKFRFIDLEIPIYKDLSYIDPNLVS